MKSKIAISYPSKKNSNHKKKKMCNISTTQHIYTHASICHSFFPNIYNFFFRTNVAENFSYIQHANLFLFGFTIKCIVHAIVSTHIMYKLYCTRFFFFIDVVRYRISYINVSVSSERSYKFYCGTCPRQPYTLKP